MTILIGAVGAFLGGLIAYWVKSRDTRGLDWTQYLIQVGVAAVLVLAWTVPWPEEEPPGEHPQRRLPHRRLQPELQRLCQTS